MGIVAIRASRYDDQAFGSAGGSLHRTLAGGAIMRLMGKRVPHYASIP